MKTTSCVLDWRGGTRDWSRNHHTLTEHNTIPVRGVNGEARHFNGVDAYLDCGNDSSLNITDTITIEIWMKPANTPTASNMIISKGAYQADGWYLYAGNTWFITYNRANEDEPVLSGKTLIINTMYHLVSVIDNTNLKIYWYVDGELIDTDNLIFAFSGNVDRHLIIGAYSTASLFFNGTISSVKIYNRALTPLEIWNNYVTMKPYIPLSESPVAIV